MRTALWKAQWHVRLMLLSFFLPPLLAFLLAVPSLFASTSLFSFLAKLFIQFFGALWMSLVVHGGFVIILFLWGLIVATDIRLLLSKNKKVVSLLRLQRIVVCFFVLISLLIMSVLVGIFSSLLKPILGLEFALLFCLVILTYKKSKIKH